MTLVKIIANGLCWAGMIGEGKMMGMVKTKKKLKMKEERKTASLLWWVEWVRGLSVHRHRTRRRWEWLEEYPKHASYPIGPL